MVHMLLHRIMVDEVRQLPTSLQTHLVQSTAIHSVVVIVRGIFEYTTAVAVKDMLQMFSANDILPPIRITRSPIVLIRDRCAPWQELETAGNKIWHLNRHMPFVLGEMFLPE